MPSEPHKLRIVYLLRSLELRGATVYARHLAGRMSGLGHEVTVLCGDPGPCASGFPPEVELVRVRGMSRRGSALFSGLRAALTLRGKGPDLLHAIGLDRHNQHHAAGGQL